VCVVLEHVPIFITVDEIAHIYMLGCSPANPVTVVADDLELLLVVTAKYLLIPSSNIMHSGVFRTDYSCVENTLLIIKHCNSFG